MKDFKRSLLFVFVLLILPLCVYAQDPNWNATLFVTPFPSPYFNDIERDPNLASLTLTYNGSAPAQFYFSVNVSSARYPNAFSSQSRPIDFPAGPHTQVFSGAQFMQWENISYNQALRDIAIRSGRLPEGEYQFCIRVMSASGPMLAEACNTMNIIYPDPPQLIFPMNGSNVNIQYPTFQWTPVITPPEYPVIYHLKIVERLQGQTLEHAIASNYPHYEADIQGLGVLVYPLDALPFETSKEYVWQITATDTSGAAPSSNNGQSEIWSFIYGTGGGGQGGGLPFELLELEQNSVFLINVASLTVQDDPGFYTLNGTASLLLHLPDGSQVTVTATVTDLQVQKGSYTPPTFISGNISASVSANDIPPSLTGEYFHPHEINFSPPANVNVSGELTLPNGAGPFQLDGQIRLLRTGLSGDATISGSPSSPIITLGDAPNRLRITRATVHFSNPVVQFDGVLELFGSPTQCELTNFTLANDGTVSSHVSCTGTSSIPLVPNSNRFMLNLNGLTGDFSASFLNNNVTFDILASGGLDFHPDDSTNIGADIVVRLQQTGISVQSFTPRGDLQISPIDLGWVKLAIGNLSLSSLSFANNNWNFALGMSLTFDFPELDSLTLPTIDGVTFGPDGFHLPDINLSSLNLPPIQFGDFGLGLTGFRMAASSFDWLSWQPGTPTNLNFGFDFRMHLPNLPAGSPIELRDPNILIQNASFTDGAFSATLTPITFSSPGLRLPITPDIGMKIMEISGALGASFSGGNFNISPDVRIRGKLDLPPAFNCSPDSQSLDLLTTTIQLSGRGGLSGSVQNVVPACSLHVGILSAIITNSNLTFSVNQSSQSILLEGAGSLVFNNPSGPPITANVNLGYEFIQNRFVTLNGNINSPFVWNIPPSNPALSFNINRATITDSTIVIDGRQTLRLGGGTTLGVTFNNLGVRWRDFSIASGNVIFDMPFALMASFNGTDLNFQAVPRDTPITDSIGILINLPDSISIDNRGLAMHGTSQLHLKLQGFDLPGLQGVFSQDFAFSFSPFRVTQGRLEFFSNSNRIAILTPQGFLPDLSYFGIAFMPERLPLPTESIAYLQLKQGDSLLINYTIDSTGLRLWTRPSQPVRLVFPALKLSRPQSPELDVTFDFTIDPLTKDLIRGNINATIPPQSLPSFDLSNLGIPFAVKSFTYGPIGGINAFQLVGQMKFFNTDVGGQDIQLTLMPDGRLMGNIDIPIDQTIPIVPNSDKLNLHITRVNGSFDAQMTPPNLVFDFGLTGGIRLHLGEGRDYGASAELGVTQNGIQVRNFNVDTPPSGDTTRPSIDLGALKLILSDYTLPSLSFDPTNGWDFEIELGMEFNFTDLDLHLPKISGIRIRKTGIHLPAISIPEMSDSSHTFMGFGLKPLAFRMSALDFNWFDYNGQPLGDWGFAFDFELSFPEFPLDVPPALKNPRVTILNAGYRNGHITGNLETKSFDQPGLQLPLGGDLNYFVRQISGALSDTGGAQNFSIHFRGDIQLPGFMRCGPDSGMANTMSTEFTIDSGGHLSGTLSGFIPSCPLDLGFGQIRITNSSVQFSISGSAQSAVMDLAGALRLPGINPGDTINAAGNLSFDLIHGQILNGQIAVTTPFRWSIPSENSILHFVVNNAVLNQSGLLINGAGSLDLAEGASIGVNFNNLLINVRNFGIVSGTVSFSNQFALKFVVALGQLQWSAVDRNATLTEETAVRLTLPQTLTLGANGIGVSGQSSILVRVNNTNFDAIRCVFTDSFNIAFSPFRIATGRASFYKDTTLVAFLDRDGFHPGDFFGVIPMPERIPLPDTSIAYLKIKSGDTVLVKTETVSNGIRISTRPGQTVQLVIPALKYNASAPPQFAISFSATINPATFAFVEGSITVSPPSGSDTLLSLLPQGIPVTITRLGFARVNNTYALRAGAKIALPAALNNVVVNLDSITISPTGISGSVNVGNFNINHLPTEQYIANVPLGTMAAIKVQGVEASFGSGPPTIRMSGDITSDLFRTSTDTAAIHYVASWASNRFNFGFDVVNDPSFQLPLLIASFKPEPINGSPAIALSFSQNDLALTLSGTLRAQGFGDGYAVSFAGLRISKDSVSVPDISITLPEDIQHFDLFGANFAIKDLANPPAKALSFAYQNHVFYLGLSGEITFMNNTSQFRNFRIGSDGSVSLQGAEFLSSPVYIVPDYFALSRVAILSGNLRVEGFVKLPAPADTTRQLFNFQVTPQGVVTGGADITVLNETPGLGNGDQTEFSFWIATFDPTYLGISLNFADIAQSSIKLVADVYFSQDANKWIHFGSHSGGVVNPGLEVRFDGNVTWGNIQFAPNLVDINWEALRLTFSNIQTIDEQSDFGLSLSGRLAINVSGSGGGLNFTDMRVRASGRVERLAESITGGDITIVDIVTITVNNIGFSDTPTTIRIVGGNPPAGPGSPGTSDTLSVDVTSYIRFGGSINIADIGSGGIEEFLAYKTPDGGSHLVIRNANFSVSGVVEFRADLRYEQSSAGFSLLVGGRGTLVDAYQIIVVGKVAVMNGETSLGFFVATSITIPIPPAIILTGLGGGFFLNPEASDLQLVRQMANLDNATGSRINADPGSFAVLLYASATIIDPTGSLIQGRILLTIAAAYIRFDGEVTVLGQGNFLRGTFYLLIGLTDAYAEGSININLQVSSVVTGTASLDFYVYSADAWGIRGAVNANILTQFEATGSLFIGNPGFNMSLSITRPFNIWVISIEAGIEGKIWYVRNVSWGAYMKAWISASVLGGVASAEGWLAAALLGEPDFYLYGIAGLSVHALTFSWDGSVWAKFKSGQVTAGFGNDPEMQRLIDAALGTSQDMSAASEAAAAQIPQANMAAMTLTGEELSAAFRTMFLCSELLQSDNVWAFILAALILEGTRWTEEGYGSPATQEEDNQFVWVINNIFGGANGAPPVALHDSLSAQRSTVDAMLGSANSYRTQVAGRLNQINASLTQLPANSYSVGGNPVTNDNFNPPVTSEYIDSVGMVRKRITSGPDFSFNQGLANQNSATLMQAQNDFNQNENPIRDRIAALESGLQTIQTALEGTGGQTSYNTVGTQFLSLLTQLEYFYKNHLQYQRDMNDWAYQKKTELESRQSQMNTAISNKTNRLSSMALRHNLALWRFTWILYLANSPDSVSRRQGFNSNWNIATDAEKITICNQTGMDLWYTMSDTGLQHIMNAVAPIAANDPGLLSDQLMNITNAQAVFTNSIDAIYDTKTRLTENLYDILARYAYWKQGQPDSIRNRPTSLTDINNRKAQLAQDLQVPRLNNISSMNTNRGFFNTGLFAWTASHPRGITDYSIRLEDGTWTSIPSAGFQEVGNSTLMARYFLMPYGGQQSYSKTLFVRARGGAGYTNARMVNFNVNYFSAGGGNGSYSYGGMSGDITAPAVGSVGFPSYQHISTFRRIYIGRRWINIPVDIYYSYNINQIDANWTGSDPESGILEYQYCVGTGYADSSVLNWQTAGGRTEVTISGLNLQHGQTYYVNVRAQNGQFMWSPVGVSSELMIDTTPPVAPAPAFWAWFPPFYYYMLPPVNSPVPLPAQLDPANGYPYTLGGFTGNYYVPPPQAPSISAVWDVSNDPESGILEYQYRVASATDSSRISPDWISTALNLNATITGAPLSFTDSFFVKIIGINYAGQASDPLRLGLYRPIDPTNPASPVAAFCYGLPAGTTYLLFTQPSFDPETGIRGYQVAVGTTVGGAEARAWPSGVDFTGVNDIGPVNSWLLPNYSIADGSYYISVRGVNNQNMISCSSVTGPFIVDHTGPIEPTATPSLILRRGGYALRLIFSNISDPQSGVNRIEIAFGTDYRRHNVLGWTNIGVVDQWESLESNLGMSPEITYYIFVRTRNQVGLYSHVFSTSFVAQ